MVNSTRDTCFAMIFLRQSNIITAKVYQALRFHELQRKLGMIFAKFYSFAFGHLANGKKVDLRAEYVY